MRLMRKLAIPQIIIVVCFGLISYFVISLSFSKVREQHVMDVVENRFSIISNGINSSAQKSVDETSVFISLPVVKEAYELALSGNIDNPRSPQSQAAREMLREGFAEMLESYYRATGEKLMLHFHLPNGFSLVRLWLDKNANVNGEWLDISDDLRSLRPTVMDVIKSRTPALGLEVGNVGFAIRGVVPIFADDGSLLGSAEVLQDIRPILDSVSEEGKIYTSLYANAGQLDFAADLRDASIYPPKGDFVNIINAGNQSVEDLISAELLEMGKAGVVYEKHSSITLAASPLTDYRGSQVGVIVCALDTVETNGPANRAAVITALMLACIAAAAVLAPAVLLRRFVTRPLSGIASGMREIAGGAGGGSGDGGAEVGSGSGGSGGVVGGSDGGAEVGGGSGGSGGVVGGSIVSGAAGSLPAESTPEKKRMDELGELSELLGILTAKLNGLLSERQAMLDRISSESFKVEELAQHEAEAKASSSAKSDYLANMSHEIRTPMNAIIGMTVIGKASNDVGRMKYSLDKIEDASVHLLGIINDVLDLSKIESGKLELSESAFSFEKMLQRVVNVISFRVEEKKQKFSLYIDRDIPAVLIGDDHRLAQIITNLMSNAVKFTPVEGSVKLNAYLSKENDKDCEIRIDVVDSGIGISSEQQARLFRPYQQADNDTSRRFGGTGLGLSISKDIVEMMGGRIWVESELEMGATFSFTVTMKRGDPAGVAGSIRETNWKNLRILAVDDDIGILGYMKRFVESSGAYCETVTCGMDALEYVRRNGGYDIYFIDWKLTDIDALQLTKALRAIDPDQLNVVVAMISTVDWGDIEEEAKQAGVARLLPKPLFPSAIADIINDFLGMVRQEIIDAIESIPVSFEGKRILLAEDIDINREIVQTLLEPTKVEIDCALDGVEAVRLFRASPDVYDLILMDIQMPIMDGYEATQAIRSLGFAKAETIPIVAMTAHVFREDIDRCLAAGMNAHVGKPLDIRELIDKLQFYLY